MTPEDMAVTTRKPRAGSKAERFLAGASERLDQTGSSRASRCFDYVRFRNSLLGLSHCIGFSVTRSAGSQQPSGSASTRGVRAGTWTRPFTRPEPPVALGVSPADTQRTFR